MTWNDHPKIETPFAVIADVDTDGWVLISVNAYLMNGAWFVSDPALDYSLLLRIHVGRGAVRSACRETIANISMCLDISVP